MTTRLTNRICAAVQSRVALGTADREAGMTTAEYAVGTVAAAGCAGLLYKVATSDQVLEVIKKLILKAFHL
jgi:hypothetical protein